MSELTPQQQQQVEDLFERLLALERHERRRILESSAVEAAVRAEVESLLGYHATASARFDTPIVSPQALLEAVDRLTAAPPGEPADDPEIVGPYHITRKLGEGGMGTVYLAEQREPLRRRVAVKLIKLGMDTRAVIRRFDAERQALALLNHPNIARAIDAGATSDGRPYFVMEYVDGEPITAYCDRHRLDLTTRLKLFVEVCRAIQHAHQKGIIHRDIKPSNVIVSHENANPVPKVIDFGVAKAIHQRLTEETLHTVHGILIGTPEYMSPEQSDANASDVDTRADIYSLGVMLYELLVGAVPIAGDSFRQATGEELHRMVREHVPEKPTTRLSRLGARAEESARNRNTDARTLRRSLRGDLDWIVMKCLEKDRDRRYAAAAELADDIERHLRREPVSAGPPSTTYRVARFVRRHRITVVGSAVVLAVLFAGVVSTAVFAVRESRQRATAQAIADFLNQELLAQADPHEQPDRDITLREVLERASDKVERRFENRPLVKAALHVTLGDAFHGLGEYQSAAAHYQSAFELRAAALGANHQDSLTCRYKLASILYEQGRFDTLAHELQTLQTDVITELGNNHPLATKVRIALGDAYDALGHYDQAEQVWSDALTVQRRRSPPDNPDLLTTASNLGLLYQEQKRWAESEPLLREAYETRRRAHGEDHPDTLLSQASLGWLYVQMARFEDAEQLLTNCVDRANIVLGTDHPRTLSYKWLLAGLYETTDRMDEALELQVDLMEQRRQALGPEHPDTIRAMNSLAQLYVTMDRLKEAQPLWREVCHLTSKIHGEAHPYTISAYHGLSRVRRMQGHPEEALSLSTKVVSLARRHLPDGHWYLGSYLTNHGKCLAAANRHYEAAVALEEACKIYRAVFGDDHDRTQKVIRVLAKHYLACEQTAEAERCESLRRPAP